MSAAALDLLRAAVDALDADHELDRHGRDRVITATLGVLHRELDAARERRTRLRLFGGPT